MFVNSVKHFPGITGVYCCSVSSQFYMDHRIPHNTVNSGNRLMYIMIILCIPKNNKTVDINNTITNCKECTYYQEAEPGLWAYILSPAN